MTNLYIQRAIIKNYSCTTWKVKKVKDLTMAEGMEMNSMPINCTKSEEKKHERVHSLGLIGISLITYHHIPP